MENSFYVTLTSNADSNFFPNNTLTNFTNKLPAEMDLSSQDYEVALVEISCAFSFQNIRSGEVFIDLEYLSAPAHSRDIYKVKKKKIELPAGNYPSENMLIQSLNELIEKSICDDGLPDKCLYFEYNNISQRVK